MIKINTIKGRGRSTSKGLQGSSSAISGVYTLALQQQQQKQQQGDILFIFVYFYYFCPLFSLYLQFLLCRQPLVAPHLHSEHTHTHAHAYTHKSLIEYISGVYMHALLSGLWGVWGRSQQRMHACMRACMQI